jgi:hypothetical protein
MSYLDDPETDNKQRAVLDKLGRLWWHHPDKDLGQVLEEVENLAWELIPTRYTSTRLGELPDKYLEQALDRLLAANPK